jgi:hypothetical protein
MILSDKNNLSPMLKYLSRLGLSSRESIKTRPAVTITTQLKPFSISCSKKKFKKVFLGKFFEY